MSSPHLTAGASGYECVFKRDGKFAATVLPEGYTVGGYSVPPSSADANEPIASYFNQSLNVPFMHEVSGGRARRVVMAHWALCCRVLGAARALAKSPPPLVAGWCQRSRTQHRRVCPDRPPQVRGGVGGMSITIAVFLGREASISSLLGGGFGWKRAEPNSTRAPLVTAST